MRCDPSCLAAQQGCQLPPSRGAEHCAAQQHGSCQVAPAMQCTTVSAICPSSGCPVPTGKW